MRGQGRNTTLALVGCLALALWLGLRRTDAPAVAIPTPALPFAPPIAPVTASEPGPPRQPAVLPAEPDELAIVVRMEGWFEPCSFVERPPLQAFQAAVYPDLLVDLPLLPAPPRWVRRMLDGTPLQPAALGQQLLDRPWLAHYAMHQQRRWDTADNQDRYLDARGDPAAEAAWFDSLDHYIEEDPALLQALSSHPDAAARDLMLAAAFQRPGIDPLPIVADRTANPLLRQLAIAHACGRGASATHFAPIDGAPTSLAIGLAAAALTAAPTEQTFAAYERAAEACRADPPAYPPRVPAWAHARGCPNQAAVTASRGLAAARDVLPARTWEEALHAAAIACSWDRWGDHLRSPGVWRGGWQFDEDDPWLVCIGDRHLTPAPPEGTRIALTLSWGPE